MSIATSLLPEFDGEMATTRRVIACVPQERATFRPHPRSFTLIELATHLANLPTWVGRTLDADELDLGPLMKLTPPKPGTVAATLATFDAQTKAARARLAEATDAALLAPWTLKKDGVALFTLPRVAVVRSFVLSHIIHHRGQMTVYLRLIDVPLPNVYGPTADAPI